MKTSKNHYSRNRSRFKKVIGVIGISLIVLVFLGVGIIGVYAIRYGHNNANRISCQACEAPLEIGDAYCFRCGAAVEKE